MFNISHHKNAKLIYGAIAAAWLLLAWAVALRAIDSGRILAYVLFFVLLTVGIKMAIKAVKFKR